MTNNTPIETPENTKAVLLLTHEDWVREMKRANGLQAALEALTAERDGLVKQEAVVEIQGRLDEARAALGDIGCLSMRRCGDYPDATPCVRCAALARIDAAKEQAK